MCSYADVLVSVYTCACLGVSVRVCGHASVYVYVCGMLVCWYMCGRVPCVGVLVRVRLCLCIGVWM